TAVLYFHEFYRMVGTFFIWPRNRRGLTYTPVTFSQGKRTACLPPKLVQYTLLQASSCLFARGFCSPRNLILRNWRQWAIPNPLASRYRTVQVVSTEDKPRFPLRTTVF